MDKMLPKGFVYLKDIDPTILQNVMYATSNNFIGRPINGYEQEIIILTEEAARVLQKIQQELNSFGLALKIMDGYRPQTAVDDIWKWAYDANDIKMKEIYYPKISNKLDLFKGYLTLNSAHSRGSTVDLTLTDIGSNQDLDMGGILDFCDVSSATNYKEIPLIARSNRALLKYIMEKFGFRNYEKEWWHYTLIDEPFRRTPEDHFYFPIA